MTTKKIIPLFTLTLGFLRQKAHDTNVFFILGIIAKIWLRKSKKFPEVYSGKIKRV